MPVGYKKGDRGAKSDEGKPPMALLDGYALGEVAKVLEHGRKKYGTHNWKEGIEVSRLISAALRHIFAFLDGKDKDEESSLSPLAHAMCELMFAIWMVKNRPDLDDRCKRSSLYIEKLDYSPENIMIG